MSTISIPPTQTMEAGPNLMKRLAAYLGWLGTAVWLFLFFRWITFSSFDWDPFTVELALAETSPLVAYLFYGGMAALDGIIAWLLYKEVRLGSQLGLARGVLGIAAAIAYFFTVGDFYAAIFLLATSGMLVLLIGQKTGWVINYPAAFWLIVFFVLPNLIVLAVSLGERSLRGTVVYPELSFSSIGTYFNDYGRFFSTINGQYLYLRILGRSVWLAFLNTAICLLFGYPFAYWIARQQQKYRNILVFLVMIPFWTNFLVRTYAWMLILRDSGLINNFWTITLHDLALNLADSSQFFAWLAGITDHTLPLLFNQSAVFLGLFYGFFPFVVLPLYSNLEKLDWSLLEAASDLGANSWNSTTRVLLPLTMPGIVAAAIIVFIPSLGAYVTPDLLGGGKVSLLGNLLQQQFMTARDWPFGSAIGFIMMALMLLAVMIYFRVGGREQ
ncbi:MAG: ABC transporter permease [Anaerolineales bacterium]|nr:ABC transporter permease [Anaerolineales bacterium]